MHLAVTGLFRAKWSAEIHEEWISNLLRNRPDLSRRQLERTRLLMDQHAVDSLVSGYEDLIPGLRLPDADDRHVLAAAIRGGADVIVTQNLRDFPAEAVEPFGIEILHPDEFVLRLFERAPEAVEGAAEDHRVSLKNPAKTRAEYLETLENQGLPRTVSALGKVCHKVLASS